MSDRLLIATLGNRDSGKSTTWNSLFGSTVKTGKNIRPLYLNGAQWVEVFLVSGSPEEREMYVSDILPQESLPQIVLCSTQYREDVRETFDFFFHEGYEVFVQWLNPGFDDNGSYEDNFELRDYLLKNGATLQVRNGQIKDASRVKELRQFILGWASYRDVVKTDFP